MKKILIALIALTFATSLCFADGSGQAAKSTSELKTFVGKIVSLEYADPTKGVDKNNMKVLGPDGNPVSFTVPLTVTLLDAATRITTLNTFKVGDTVKVERVKDEVRSVQKTR
ncbi:MAG: hypothetical protein A3K16_04200 [Omnitrophica bacterium RIFCSPLOWO2_01_FULL_45_24]|nr:MAG: hypothetical protein A3C51_05605 [Omnitrophica bacterium RIFCSPHIGHO2_02_FULL_46_20]OGW94460.1 MAG: hypothetical protein A3G36_05840 [Omnitrophica bacterium RIFCSPLOWO2_12_FULL_45_13]OGW94982.1 MAG: hypothetical protein A3K16_04200 [Omnitrophica bacterium RIFCSPLOWO2_01_FULL_45_24]